MLIGEGKKLSVREVEDAGSPAVFVERGKDPALGLDASSQRVAIPEDSARALDKENKLQR